MTTTSSTDVNVVRVRLYVCPCLSLSSTSLTDFVQDDACIRSRSCRADALRVHHLYGVELGALQWIDGVTAADFVPDACRFEFVQV